MQQNLFKKILWFDNRVKYDIDFFDCLQPQRIVSKKSRYKSGLFYSDKCKRNIQYESGIELNFIKLLESSKKVKFYYEQPVRIKYRRGRKNETYTPDFGIYLKTNEFVLVEIKDLHSILESRIQTKTEALLDFCSKKGFGLLLTDGKNTIDKLLRIKNNRKLEIHVLKAIENNVLRKKECSEIMERCNATQNELYKVIIRNHLKYRIYPFKLQLGNKNDIFRQVFIEKRRYDDIMMENQTTLFK